MKKIVGLSLLSLALLSCKNEELQLEQEKTLTLLEQQNDSLKSSVKRVVNKRDSLSTLLKKSKNEFNEKSEKISNSRRERLASALPVLKKALYTTSEYFYDNYKSEPYNGELVHYNEAIADLLFQTPGEVVTTFETPRYEGSDWSLFRRVRIGKERDEDYYYSSTSRNNKESDIQFPFEYLGDCIGLEFGIAGFYGEHQYRFLQAAQLFFSTEEEVNYLTDHVSERMFAVMEAVWSSPNERATLKKSLRYVLETTENIDYAAQLDLDMRFLNEKYENRWNGIQKFFFRINRKFPGSAERIRENIREFLQS